MSEIYIKYEGVKISFKLSEVYSCCGLRQIHCLRVSGNDSFFTKKDIKLIYTKLKEKLIIEMRDEDYLNKVSLTACDGIANRSDGFECSSTDRVNLAGFMLYLGARKPLSFESGVTNNNLTVFFLQHDKLSEK